MPARAGARPPRTPALTRAPPRCAWTGAAALGSWKVEENMTAVGEQSSRTPTSSTRLLLLGSLLARSPCRRSTREGWRRVEGWSGGGSPGDSATSRSTPESSAAQNIWQWDSSRHSSALPSSQLFAKIHHPHSISRQFLEPAPSVSNRDSV